MLVFGNGFVCLGGKLSRLRIVLHGRLPC